MKGDRFIRTLSYIDPALIERADKEKKPVSAHRLWTAVSAVAAVIVIAVGVFLTLPLIPASPELDYELYSEDGHSALEYENVGIYYPKGTNVERRLVRLPSSTGNVFCAWCHFSDVEGVTLVGISEDADAYTDAPLRLMLELDGKKIYIFLSPGLGDNMDRYSLLATSLKRTLCEYLESRYTSSVTEQNQKPDTQPEGSGTPDTTPPAESEEERLEREQREREELYARLTEAIDDKEYQYAYGLAAFLSADDYLDSRELRTELFRRAHAVYFTSCYMDSVASENCSLDPIPENASMINGVLYIGEGGTPRFIYYDDYDVICEIIPDTTLTDVVSIIISPDYYMRNIPQFYQCITKDGDVRILCNSDLLMQDAIYNSEYHELTALMGFTRELSGVNKIVYEPESMRCAYLHDDGHVSVFESPVLEYSDADRAALERVSMWTDIVDMSYDGISIVGLRSDGTVLYELLRERYKDNPHVYDPTALYSELSEQGVYITTFGSIDLGYTASFRILADGKSYPIRGGKLGTPDLGRDVLSGAPFLPRLGYIYNTDEILIDTDGALASYSSEHLPSGINSCDGICSISTFYETALSVITVEGNVIFADIQETDHTRETLALLDLITVHID